MKGSKNVIDEGAAVGQSRDRLCYYTPHHARKWRGRGIFDVVLLKESITCIAFSSVVRKRHESFFEIAFNYLGLTQKKSSREINISSAKNC